MTGMTGSGSGIDSVDVSVVWDDGSLQAWADEEYGERLVRVSSSMRPVT